MYRKKSDYALNKLDPDAIVYQDATGEIHRLTRKDFDSEEEFLRWKKWSDENYHADEKKEIKVWWSGFKQKINSKKGN